MRYRPQWISTRSYSLRVVALALLLVTSQVFPATAGADPVEFGRAPEWRIAVLPLGRLIGVLVQPFRGVTHPPDAMPLTHQQGWQSLHLPIEDRGVGVYLVVKGSVRFDIAYVDYADGSQDRIELHQAVRHDGLFALTEFDSEREIRAVSLLLCADSHKALVTVRIGK